jgi:energy-coupling factor transporter ATP-binding protein EcfA2
MTNDAQVVSFQGVRFVYPGGGTVALDGVTFDVVAGQTLAIAGQNGSGKTTLTKLLNGLLHPTSGRVVVHGTDTSGRPVQELARHVGYVFQNPNHQLFARSVSQELAFGPRNLGLAPSDVEIRVAEAAEALGLSDVLEAHPYHLSFPIRKLVSIASVVTMRPSILVLDEPTTGQDDRTIDAIARAIVGLSEGGTTIVCVSHDMQFVARVADRILVMRQGRVVSDGTVREVFADIATLAATGLEPPQITRLSLALPRLPGSPPALTTAELIEAVLGRPVGHAGGST